VFKHKKQHPKNLGKNNLSEIQFFPEMQIKKNPGTKKPMSNLHHLEKVTQKNILP